jgi:hypothetical protein
VREQGRPPGARAGTALAVRGGARVLGGLALPQARAGSAARGRAGATAAQDRAAPRAAPARAGLTAERARAERAGRPRATRKRFPLVMTSPTPVASADLVQPRTGEVRVREAPASARGVREADVRGVRVVKAGARAGTPRSDQPRTVRRAPERHLVGGGLHRGQDRVARDQTQGEHRDARPPGRRGRRAARGLRPAEGRVGRGLASEEGRVAQNVGPEEDQRAGAPGLGEHRVARGLGRGRRRGARALGTADGRVLGQIPGERPVVSALGLPGRRVSQLRERRARGGPARPATAPHGRGPVSVRRVTGRPRSRPTSPRTSSTRRHARS